MSAPASDSTELVRKRGSTPFVVPLGAVESLASVGAKAFNLAQMRRMNLPVPPGFVITTAAFDRFLDANGLRPRITSELTQLNPAEPASFDRASHRIRELIPAAEMPVEIWHAVQAARAHELPDTTLIVRSSAVGEDGPNSSFAGQLDSLHPVNTEEELRLAILQCWASYWSARSLSYQHSGRGRLDGMGVLVQHLVPAAVAGVVFTQGTEPGRMYGEYCHGHGEALVSGQLNPGRLTISRETLLGTIEAVPDQPANDALDALLRIQLTELARHGLKLERALGGSQDIEWVIHPNGDLFLVQSRSITVGPGREKPSVPRQRSVQWSNANVNENFPEPICPLLYSIASAGYYHYFRNLALGFGIARRRVDTMEAALRRIIGVHGARMYYNLTAIHDVLRCAPGGRRLVEFFNRFVGAESSDAAMQDAARASGAETVLELAIIAIKTGWQYLFFRRRVERFERTVTRFCEATSNEVLNRRKPQELLGAMRGFLHIRFDQWNNAALADTAAMVTYGLLGNFLKGAFPESQSAGLHNSLLKGMPGLVSGVPPLRLWEISRHIRKQPRLRELFRDHPDEEIIRELRREPVAAEFMAEVDKFLRTWGFRFSGELMLTVPALDEQPVAVIRWLRSYCEIDGESPAAVLSRQAIERQEHLDKLCAELGRRRRHPRIPRPLQAPWLRLLLDCTQTSISLRERARFKQAQLYNRCRHIALATGAFLAAQGHIADPDDVFFLTFQELEELLGGTAMFPHGLRALVELRRKEHVRMSAQQPPDHFSLEDGEYLSPNGDAAPLSGAADTARTLQGLSACGGQAEGRAVVLRDLAEGTQLRAGDILVTRQTDPGWGPVFFLIKGLVLERGGMLSHGAIIAREYGIPAIVGVAQATGRISTGQHVRVDGDSGHVELLD